MAIDIQARVGNTGPAADGSASIVRLGRENDVIVSELAGRYGEATRRGETFSLMLAATTTGIAAGNITGAAAAASTQFALWNANGNTKALEILKVYVGVISGTPPGGPLFHNLMISGVPTVASSGSPKNNLAGGSGPTAQYMASAAGAVLTGGVALSALRPMAFNFSSAAFSDAAGTLIMEQVDGDIVIPPGYGWVPCWASAGTSVLNAYGVTWREVPWP